LDVSLPGSPAKEKIAGMMKFIPIANIEISPEIVSAQIPSDKITLP